MRTCDLLVDGVRGEGGGRGGKAKKAEGNQLTKSCQKRGKGEKGEQTGTWIAPLLASHLVALPLINKVLDDDENKSTSILLDPSAFAMSVAEGKTVLGHNPIPFDPRFPNQNQTR